MSNTPNPVYKKLMKCYESFRSQIDFQPEVALILGSGLGDFANDIRVTATLDYHDIEGFPVSTVPGHAGRFIFGYVGDVPVVCMQGRVHYYEGYPMTDVVLPTRLMKLMGAKALFLTNAAGGIKQGTKPGSLMLLNGQIACFVPSPLIGPNIDELGTRFPDMSQIYDLEFQKIARKAAACLDIDLMEGVYLGRMHRQSRPDLPALPHASFSLHALSSVLPTYNQPQYLLRNSCNPWFSSVCPCLYF